MSIKEVVCCLFGHKSNGHSMNVPEEYPCCVRCGKTIESEESCDE